MSELTGGWFGSLPWTGILEIVIDVYLKAAVVCALAGLVTWVLRRSSAYARSIVWVFTLVVLLALPFSQAVSPVWRLPILPGIEGWLRGPESIGGILDPSGKELDAAGSGGADAGASGVAPSARSALADAGWRMLTAAVWLAGVLLSLAWLLVRAAVGKHLVLRCCRSCETWGGLLAEAASWLGLTRHVRLLESEEIEAAVTIGAINPTIVVPAGSAAWPVERRRYVLSHELAHVKRRDGIIEILALVATGVYWLNPLVWLAVRSLRVERERDCDDVVLSAGAKPSEYALFLMDIASALGTPRRPAWRLSTISQGSNLKDRIMCILDPKIDRKRTMRATVIVSCFLILSLILPLSMSGIWETQAQEQKTKQEEKECKEKEAQKKAQEEIEKKLEMKKKQMGEKISREEKINLVWEKIEANEKSAAARVHMALLKKGPGAGVKMVEKIKKAGGDAYSFDEKEFNTLGYKFLFDKKVEEALEVFKLNAEMYPESWNVYDSLGEACLAAGKYEKAKKLYEKSLALNPENDNGKLMLEKVAQAEAQKKGESVAKEK